MVFLDLGGSDFRAISNLIQLMATRNPIPNHRLDVKKPVGNTGIFTISTGERRISEPSTEEYVYLVISVDFHIFFPGNAGILLWIFF